MGEALSTATSGAAAVFGLGEETGRLRAGLAADLLVLDGELSTDPTALGRPVEVLARGERVRSAP
jgi:imidazolonepropionase-like amidohydrolase